MRGLVLALAVGLFLGLGPGLRRVAAQEAPPANTLEEAALNAVGVLTGSHMYTLYGYIGTVSDLYGYEKFDAATTQSLLGEVNTMCTNSTKALQALRNKASENDRKGVDEFIAIYELLQKQSQAIIDHTQTKAQGDIDRFTQSRQACWAKLKVVLRIPDPPATTRSVDVKSTPEKPAVPAPPKP